MKLTDNDLRYVVSRLSSDVRSLLKDNAGRVFLAGGFIRAVIAGEEVSDVDLFGSDKTSLEGLADKFSKNVTRQGARIHKTGNAITVLSPERLPVQFITRWVYTKPEDVKGSFDYTVCAAVIWYDGFVWQSDVHERFYEDLAARRLHYTAPVRDEEVGGSMLRAIKYIKRGYVMQADSLGAVIGRIVDTVRDQGAESGRPGRTTTEVVTGLLREVDPSLSMNEIEIAGDDNDEFDLMPSKMNAGMNPAYGTA